MDAIGNPDFQDVREGNATYDPLTDTFSWLPGKSPSDFPAGTVQVSALPDTGLSPDVVTISSPKKDTSWMVLVLLAAGALWLSSE